MQTPAAIATTAFGALDGGRLRELVELLGADAVVSAGDLLDQYGRDATETFCFPPQAAVLPSEASQVQTLMRFATRHRIPVTPRGAGTGLSGGALPVCGGIALSLERMNRIRSVDLRNLCAEAEAGVITGDLQRRVEEDGLFYPPDPASRDSCFLGGNIAEDSAGPRSCKYGSTRKWILGLEAVLADGSRIVTGGANRKDVAGYNLTQLLVGSEGTLAVVTAATMRLISLPRHTLTLAAPFPTLESGAAAIEEIFRRGFDPAACELIEEFALAVVEQALEVPPALSAKAAVILLELDGQDSDRLLEEAVDLGELMEELGAGEVLVAQEAADQRRLWQVRRAIGEALKHASVYKEADTVVPRSKLAELVRTARRAAEEQGLRAVCFGHAGDGNLHTCLLRGDLDEKEWEIRRDAAEGALFQAVTELGGSITGEHGVGWTQRQYLPLSVAPPALEVMRQIKQAFDPLGIVNPGKIFVGR